MADEEIWAPHLHEPADKATVGPWLLGLLNATGRFGGFEPQDVFLPDREIKFTVGAEEHTGVVVAINPEVTQRLLVLIGEFDYPSGTTAEGVLALRFHADQWVAIRSSAPLSGEEHFVRVQADDFALALAKTLEVWREKFKTEESGPGG